MAAKDHSGARTSSQEFLRAIPLFRSLPASEREHMAHSLTLLEVPGGTLLFQEGEPGDRLYIVVEGEMEVVKAMGLEAEYQVAICGPGEVVGDLSLLSVDGLRNASVRALTPATLWVMPHAELHALLQRQPRFAYELLRILGARLTQTENTTIQDLLEKNRQLTASHAELQAAYQALQQAQAQVIEKETLEREMRLAYEIQMSILPDRLPSVPGYDLGARIVPARMVGGDFFDAIPLDAERVGLVVGDVADKGMPAAIFMARTHALIYAEAFQCPQPGELLRRVNRHLMALHQPCLFVTVLYGVLDRRTGIFAFARAGHERPILLLPDGEIQRQPLGPGQLLGVFPDPDLDERELTIPPGGTLLLFTDGLTEGRDKAGEPFGAERLRHTIRSLKGSPAQGLCDGLLEALYTYQGGKQLEDDITLLAVRLNKNPRRLGW